MIAVCIGDINTGELYYYRPGSPQTHRITQEARAIVPLQPETKLPMSDQYLLLRDPIERHPGFIREWIESRVQSGFWKNYSIIDGSIGLSMARLWKGEVGACVLAPNTFTPWDMAPVIGMSHRLGIRVDSMDAATGEIWPYNPRDLRNVRELSFGLLFMHVKYDLPSAMLRG